MLDKRHGLHRMLFSRVSFQLHFYLLVLLQKPFSFSRVLAVQFQRIAAYGRAGGRGSGVGGLVGSDLTIIRSVA